MSQASPSASHRSRPAHSRNPTWTWFPYVVLAPMMLWFAIFILYPVVYSLWTSLHLWTPALGAASPFVGFKNYIDLFTIDPFFMTALKNTLRYGLVVTAVVVPLGYFLAFGLRQIKHVSNAYTFVYFLPYLMPASHHRDPLWLLLSACVWDRQLHVGVGGSAQTRLAPGSQAGHLDGRDRGNVAAYRVRHFDYLFGAGCAAPALFEAARIDGAGTWRIFRSITTPLMSRVLVFVSAVTMITALQTFDLIYVMTRTGGGTGGSPGGPGTSTYTLALLVYLEGLQRFKVGPATAVSSMLLAMVLIFTIVQLRFFKAKWDYYQD